MDNMQNKKKDRLILLLLFLAVFFAAVALWALFGREEATVFVPDVMPDMEENAQPLPETGDDSAAVDGDEHVRMTFGNRVTIDLSKETAALTFANPAKSAQAILLQVEIQGQVLLQSGTLMPGTEVSELELLPKAAEQLQEGVYEGQFHLYYYSPETGERADADVVIPITIAVKH